MTTQFPGGPATPDTPATGVPATRACGRTGPAGPPESFEAEVAAVGNDQRAPDPRLVGAIPQGSRHASASDSSCRDGESRGGWLAVPADTLDLWDIDEDQIALLEPFGGDMTTERFKLLDLFCGAGGASVGYAQAGFEVVGVDLVRSPHYPFEFHQADALEFPLDGFAAVHASPPCQAYANVTRWRGDQAHHPDLIHAMRVRLARTGIPWVMENVPEAPIRHDYLLCGSMFGLTVKRHRAFETSWGAPDALQAPCGSHHRLLPFMHKGERAYADAMGCTWMTKEEAREAIPPAYCQFIGQFLMAAVRERDAA